MNRFKFRIWDSHRKEFLPYSCMVNHLDPDEFYCFDRWFKMSEEGCVLQQWTELFDKNKNPIYEGDIVKYARSKIESVEFAKNCFKSHAIELGEEIGEILYIKPSFCLSFDHIRYDDIAPMGLAEHRYEVIGNVFETPELLKL